MSVDGNPGSGGRPPGRARTPSSTRRLEERDRALALRLDLFKRLYRWLNLTLVHQGIWPLLVVLASAPAVPVAATPPWWWLARTAAPAAAALLALAYLRQQPAPAAGDGGAAAGGEVADGRTMRRWAWVLPGLAGMLAAARLAAGPLPAAAKLIGFGAADVLAFQLIHFGVVRRSWGDDGAGTFAAVALFGASWGLRDLFLAAAAGGGFDAALVFTGGAGAGWTIAAVSWAARRWVGGFWPAAAVHFILVYLVLGFA